MTKKQQQGLIFILGTLAALGPLSIDMYLPGFPAIAEDLGTDVAHVSLTLTSYFIGISVGQLIYGPLVDRFGRKKPLIIGLSIFAVAAIGCAISPDVYWLIGMRLLLALGGCVGMVATQAIVRDIFPVQETARVFSSLLLVMGVAPIIAPTLGGFISALFGWRYIFVFLSLFSILLIGIIVWRIAESRGPDTDISLRFKAVGKAYMNTLRNRQFLIYTIAGSIGMASMFAYISGGPFILMDLYGLSDHEFGWVFGFNAFGFITGSQVNRFLLKRFSGIGIVHSASTVLLFIAAMLCIGTAMHWLSVYNFVALLFLFLFMLGFINPNTTALALEPFEKTAGTASAMIGSLRMFTGALISALMGAMHNGTALPMVFIMAGCAIFVATLMFYYKKKQ